MSILCLFGRHKPSPVSLARRKHGGVVALCESCGMPLERSDKGSWHVVASLVSKDRAGQG